MTRLAVVLTAVFALAACGAPRFTPTRAVPAMTSAANLGPPLAPGDARTALDRIPVKGPAPKTGYNRAEFGAAWVDTDHDGCDQRNDVLARDLRDPVRTGCKVTAGTLVDPYTGKVVTFVAGPGTSTAVQIDHVVALGDAWQTGAQQWSAGKRAEFANDLGELMAVSGPVNAAKGDRNAAAWVPPSRTVWCRYASVQVQVKARYGLWTTSAEHDALARLLGSCP